MRILLTGASGFLGKAILNSNVKDEITTLSRARNSNITCDLAIDVPIIGAMDLVIHAAGKAHSVPKTALQKQEFFRVNVEGTRNLLLGLEKSPRLPSFFVFISTVAVYGKDKGELIGEDCHLNATDAYGLSKIIAEKIVIDWCKENNVIATILRLPLLAGTNPPGNLRAMINGIKKGYYFNIAKGEARKSMVLVEDVAQIIPLAAAIGGVYNLTDGYHPSFLELSEVIAAQLNKSQPLNIPIAIARILAAAGDIIGAKAPINSDKLRKINSDLTFNDAKARRLLGWKPAPVLSKFKIQ